LIIDLLILDAVQTDNLVHATASPFTSLIQQTHIISLLIISVFLTLIITFIFRRQLSFLRAFWLICIYRGLTGIFTGDPILGAVLLGITLLLLLGTLAENIDNCFCSRDFTQQTNTMNIIYLTGIELAIVVVRTAEISLKIQLIVCCILLSVWLIRRIWQPYINSLLQSAEITMFAISFVHSIAGSIMKFIFDGQGTFVEKYLLYILTVVLIPILAIVSHKINANTLKIYASDIN
jgi:hypothetical protein